MRTSIPRPRQRALVLGTDSEFALINQMRLENDTKFFTEFKAVMRQLVKEFDINLDMSFDTQNRPKFVENVMKRLPRLQDYEDLWPAESYLYLYLKGTMRMRPQAIQKILSLLFCRNHRDRKHVQSDSPSMNGEKDAVLVQGETSATPVSPEPSPCHISNFLMSLNPAQPGLIEVLKGLGIVDATTFDAFATLLRREEWQAELVYEGKMTWLQSALISVAMHKYMRTRTPPRTRGLHSDFSSADAVHNFLMNISPPLPHLIPRFERLGILDKTTLVAAARLEHRELRLKRLVERKVLTALEVRIVGEAMADLLRKGAILS